MDMQACFDANTGKYSTCKTLSRASEGAEGSWKAVGLLMTTSHIVVTGSNGSIDWLTLPSENGEDLEVRQARRVWQSFRPAYLQSGSPLRDKYDADQYFPSSRSKQLHAQ